MTNRQQDDQRRRREVIDQLAQLDPDDVRSMIDLVQMYRAGRRAALKAIITALVGALVTAVGYGIVHWIKAALGVAAIAFFVKMVK